MNAKRYRIYNLDRHFSMPHLALDTQFDRGVVYDLEQTEKHPITGEDQRKLVFRGLIPECVAWVSERE